jgi:hypothetical protein
VFQYGTTTSYGQTVAAAGGAAKAIIDLDLHGVSAMVGGLAPTTTYHFRIKATNQFGQVAYGPDRTFTTAATLPPAPPAESPADPGTTPPPTGTVDPGGAVVAPAADRAAPRCTAKLVRTLRRGRATLSGRCSEAATLRVTIAGRLAAKVRVPAGTFRRTIKVGTLRPGRRIVRIVARDVAGNSAAALRLALKPRR